MPKAQIVALNVLLCPNSKDISFTIIKDEKKQAKLSVIKIIAD